MTHEVLDSEEELGSGGMLAAADRTPTSEERVVPHGPQNTQGSRGHVKGAVEREDYPSHHRLGRPTGHKQTTEAGQDNTRGSKGLMGPKAEGNSGGQKWSLTITGVEAIRALLSSRHKLHFSADADAGEILVKPFETPAQ